MDIANDLHTLFKSRRETFKIVDGQPTDSGLHHIVKEPAKLLYTIQFEK